MSFLTKTIISGFLTGILGIIFIPFAFFLEEDFGLDILFRIRGERTPPSEVVVVTLDKASADKLNLPPEPYKWSRSLHARLIRNLSRNGAKIIVFDLIFKEPGPPEEDALFVQAMKEAGNVVLCEQLESDTVAIKNQKGADQWELKIERMVPLIPSFAQAAAATAPFPLPKIPVKVSQYWTFKQSAGGVPSLPVAAFQTYNLDACNIFFKAMKQAAPNAVPNDFMDKFDPLKSRNIINMMMEIKKIFNQIPHLKKNMHHAIDLNIALKNHDERTHLKSLVNVYIPENSRYLDFYGPPGAIPTIPFYKLLTKDPDIPDMFGKAVFIGLSECLRPEEKDGFYTTFSQKSGVDISGVEIAATAFANLLENRHIKPMALLNHMMLIFVGGLILGMLCRLLSPFAAACALMVILGGYLTHACYQFTQAGIWLPLMLPIFIQAPFAFFSAFLSRYLETRRENLNAVKALGYYVPGKVARQIVKNTTDIRENNQVFEGVCLCTDAENYTTLSETMAPESLAQLMNSYFETIFRPVKLNNGRVTEVVGDAMIAIWPGKPSESAHRHNACAAALGIIEAVNQFNRKNNTTPLPTRIGLHTGRMMIGNIGAIDRYEYNPIGDMVNTTSRIEGLNKYLETRILASEEAVAGLTDFLTRNLGRFILAGKTIEVVIYEVMCHISNADTQKKTLCEAFSSGLKYYKDQNWEKGIHLFSELIHKNGEDGPSRFYLEKCLLYRCHSPVENFSDVINLNQK